MPSLNYAKQYAQALSQAYPNVLHFGALFARKQEGDYRWTNSKTVEVPTISVTGRFDGNRDNIGSKTRRHNNTYTPLTLRNHRAWDDLIHPRDIAETNGAVAIQNITKVFNEEQKFPEKDKYLISTLYSDWCTLGRVARSDTLSASNVLTYFDAMMEDMTEHNVPASGRILYITTRVDTMLKNAQNFYRNLDVKGDTPASVQRALSYLDQVAIEVVPSDHMLTAYDFTLGAVRGASAKQIMMFLVHPNSVITPENYDFAQLDEPSAGSDGKYVYFEESFEDVFILPNKQYGLDFIVADVDVETATFSTSASSKAGAVVGDAVVTMSAPTGTNVLPGSRYFYKVANGTAPAIPKTGVNAEESGFTEFDPVNGVVNGTNTYKITILVTDIDGRVYAGGSDTLTSKTA